VVKFAPEHCHEYLLKNAPLLLAFSPEKDFEEWRRKVDAKLREIIGDFPRKTSLNLRVEYERENELFWEKRFIFTSEAEADVPCHLLVPKEGKGPFPLIVCLQGHTKGMHLSLGRSRDDEDEQSIRRGDRDFAVQAVHQGYAALALEQRCFGERADRREKKFRHIPGTCHHAAMTALLLGRTMIGERVWDVSRAIDAISEFPEIDKERIGCMGNSGGGTITYFAACLEPRIKAIMPSCYVCTFRESIGKIDHCECNYIPGFLKYFDLPDLACLIAPRPLVVVAGRQDEIFPIEGVKEAFDKISQIYEKVGAPDKCRLVIGEGGHRFYAEIAWPIFRKITGW